MIEHQLFKAEQIRTNEAIAAKRCGVAMYTLMERAGQAVFMHSVNYFADALHYVVLVGVGNNAGDGYIVANLAKQAGKNVTVIAAVPDKPLSGDALTAQQAWLDATGEIATDFAVLEQADVIVDGFIYGIDFLN